jgi:hypothetical protein
MLQESAFSALQGEQGRPVGFKNLEVKIAKAESEMAQQPRAFAGSKRSFGDMSGPGGAGYSGDPQQQYGQIPHTSTSQFYGGGSSQGQGYGGGPPDQYYGGGSQGQFYGGGQQGQFYGGGGQQGQFYGGGGQQSQFYGGGGQQGQNPGQFYGGGAPQGYLGPSHDQFASAAPSSHASSSRQFPQQPRPFQGGTQLASPPSARSAHVGAAAVGSASGGGRLPPGSAPSAPRGLCRIVMVDLTARSYADFLRSKLAAQVSH